MEPNPAVPEGTAGASTLAGGGGAQGGRFEELCKRVLRSFLVLIGVLIVNLTRQDVWMPFLLQPVVEARPGLAQVIQWGGCSYGPPILPILASLIVAFFLSSPWICFQMWIFAGTGLAPRDGRRIVIYAPLSLVLFILGCVFGYLQLIPSCLNLSTDSPFSSILGSNPYSLADYLNLVLLLTIVLGAALQIPLVMTFLSQVGKVTASRWSRWRKQAIIANALFAAVITPPDPAAMIIVLLPLLALYEIGVLFSKLLEKRTPDAWA